MTILEIIQQEQDEVKLAKEANERYIVDLLLERGSYFDQYK